MAKIFSDDTICAIATPWGQGALGIIRLSGPESFPIADAVFRSASGRKVSEFESHSAHYGRLVDSKGEIVDEVMLTVFRKPRSYTSEDVIEIGMHGGMKVLKSALELLVGLGARLAEPGEFTKRAFLHGRLDLAQAEAVLDLIKAKTDSAQKQAVRALQGEFSGKIRGLRERLLKLCATVEALLDFPDEELGIHSDQEGLKDLVPLRSEMRRLIESYRRGAVLREGILAVIVGRPNVGKSSILNALLDRDRAIVSNIPGTTRDVLEEELEIGGLLVRIVDTAGISSKAEGVEKIGIRKTRECLKQADLALLVMDGSESLTAEDRKIFRQIGEKKKLCVVNKSDLDLKMNEDDLRALGCVGKPVFVSARNRTGFQELEAEILRAIGESSLSPEAAWVTRARHREALVAADKALEHAQGSEEGKQPLELVAFDLRQALDRLGEITGEIYTEDILDAIFREFCIGK